jgi:predicted nucleotidyltransferase
MLTSEILDKINLNYNEQQGLNGAISELTCRYPFIEQVILYGSKTRGDSIEESDIDILIVTEYPVPRETKYMISDIIYNNELKHDVIISAIIVPQADYRNKISAFLINVRKEGILIWSRE